jgi:hypothetical protein
MNTNDCLKNFYKCNKRCSNIFYIIYEKISIKINDIINNINNEQKYNKIPLDENKKEKGYNINEWDIV